MKKFFLLIFSTAFLWGCSTSIVSKEPGEEVSQRQTAAVAVVKADKSPPPKWVLLKSGAFSNGGNFTFRGIGYSKPDTTPEETNHKFKNPKPPIQGGKRTESFNQPTFPNGSARCECARSLGVPG